MPTSLQLLVDHGVEIRDTKPSVPGSVTYLGIKQDTPMCVAAVETTKGVLAIGTAGVRPNADATAFCDVSSELLQNLYTTK